MDIATLIGLVFGMTVVILAILVGSDLWVFLNLPGFLIVVAGTFAATLIKFPISTVFVAFKTGVQAAFITEKNDPKELVRQSIQMAQATRSGGLLALEKVQVENAFFRKGIRMCVDGHSADIVRKTLTDEMNNSIQRHEEGEKIFRGIGESAPAFGMIGTLIGLVQMLSNMEDPKTIGPAMSIALLTTLYGAVIANLVALPMADKLASKTEQERLTDNLIIESVIQIQNGQNPRVLSELLQVFLPEHQRTEEDQEEEEA